MAGSYKHAVTASGNLVSPERIGNAAENLGDAYETIEEMYGMIWYLAARVSGDPAGRVAAVEDARVNYRRGLEIAREANRGA
jgi:hypothetical protein